MRRVSLLTIASLLFLLFLTACGGAAPAATPMASANVLDFNSVGVDGAIQAYRLTAPAGYTTVQTVGTRSNVRSADSSVTFQVAEVNPQEAAVAQLTEVGNYTVNGRDFTAYTYNVSPNTVYFLVPVDSNVYNVLTTTTDMSEANLEMLANIAGTLEVVNE